MKKRNYLSLLATLAAIGAASGLTTPTVQADGGNEADKSLLPVVFLTLDTSGSMLEDPDTLINVRFTNAIQELTGRAAVDTSDNCKNAYADRTINTCIVHPNDIRYPRKELTCDKANDRCYYRTVWVCGINYKTNGNHGRGGTGDCEITFNDDGGNHNRDKLRRAHRQLINGFDGDEASFEAQYSNTGLIQNYMNTVKFGMVAMAQGASGGSVSEYHYGNHVTKVPGFVDGDLNGSEYHYGFKGLPKTGAWGNELKLFTPLLYPTTSDDINDVRASNEAVIYNIRSYTIRNWGTPLGGMIKAISYMFSNEKEGGKPDPALTLQPKPTGKYLEPIQDDAWACRPKAVVALTDGVPNASGDPSARDSAYELYKLGVKVYAIAYGTENASPVGGYTNIDTIMGLTETEAKNPGVLMNKIAWKGGTCREYGHVGDIIDPTNETAYREYLANYMRDPVTYKPCFYNAFSGTALREAMVSIISELLEGYTSKSKMVTTTAVGKLTTVDSDRKPVNGWYNVYSGYKVNLGAIRNSGLQRETYACRDGKFEYDKSLFIDMAKKLDDRLAGCRSESMFSDPSHTGPTGNCMTNRAIFVGDYSSDVEAFRTGRYAVKPERVHFSEAEAGIFRYGSSSDSKKYQFFAYDQALKSQYETARTSQITLQNEAVNEQVLRYMISPYECKSEIDCIGKATSVEEQYLCDKGKCVLQSDLQGQSCIQGLSRCNASNEVCINGQCRAMATQCDQHNDCMSGTIGDETYETQNQVCHAGTCTNGVLVDGDIRDFMASIPLGAIEYASPVIVGPPSYSYHGADYVTYKNKYADRDTMMYVPANDGMLHAFILGKNNDKKYNESMFNNRVESPVIGKTTPSDLEGEELWAFVPKAVMPNLHSLTDFGEQKKINVAPVYADVQFPDGAGGGEWHSVIVGGFREGGRGYYALDVTEPNDPKILWEIDHQWQSVTSNVPYPEINNNMTLSEAQDNQNKKDGLYPFGRMGYSYPEAIITNVIVNDEVVPVAILPGGVATGNPTTDCVTNEIGKQVCFDDVTGKAVYVVRLNPSSKDDLLVREFQFDTRISGTPAAFPAGFNSIARVIYVGDENGALHRIDISDPNMNNWKIDGLSVITEGKVAKPNGTLYPIFDPNNIENLQGTPRRTYEKITYKPAVSALTATGFPDIQIVFGSGDSSVTSVGSHDLNYTAYAIDHYMGNETGYQLNNFESDKEKDAYTRNLDPLVIVFNPMPGITAQPLASYDVPNGKKQYYEVWAGKVAEDTIDPGTGGDGPDPNPCDYCTSEQCKDLASSCHTCPICKCYDSDEQCDLVVESCKECVKENYSEYQTCLDNIESSPKCKDCKTNCHHHCDVENGECVEKCRNEEKSRFCTTVCSSTIISALTWLYGGCESECNILWAGITGYLDRWQSIYNVPEEGITIDNYCDNEKDKCDKYCESTGYWQYQSDCLEEVEGCVSECREQEEACDNNCDNRFSTCRSNADKSYNTCLSNAHNYCESTCGGGLFHGACVWTCEHVTRPADCWISKVGSLAFCDTNWAGCRIGCNQYVCDIGCVTDWTWCAVGGCQANCATDKLDCKIRVEAYKFLDGIRNQFTDSSLKCDNDCTTNKVACYQNCNTTCKDKCTCPPQTPCEPGGALTEDQCTCDPSDYYADDDEKQMCTDYGFGSGRSRAAKRASSGSGLPFDIRTGQKMMGPALTYNFKSYFPTYNATLSTGACNDGFASIWMIDRTSASLHWQTKNQTQVQNKKTTGVTGAMDHGKSETTFEANHYINLANGTRVYGLAMTPQAICIKGDKATIAAPQLIAQTGGASGASGASQSAAGGFTKTGDTLSDGESTNINLLSITEDAIKAEPDVLSWASVYE